MFRKYTSLALVGLLLNLAFYSSATANTETDAKSAEKVKTSVAKLGTGKDAKVKIKLKDGAKLKGYVSKVKDSGFVVTDEKTGKDSEIQYLQVKQVEGQNLSKGEKILLRSSLIIGAIFLYGFYLSRSSDY
jgi:hypothetical protein